MSRTTKTTGFSSAYLSNLSAFSSWLDELAVTGGFDPYRRHCIIGQKCHEAVSFIAQTRPDLIMGAHVHPTFAGGVSLSFFRDGCEYEIDISKSGGADVFRRRDSEPTKLVVSETRVNALFLAELEALLPECSQRMPMTVQVAEIVEIADGGMMVSIGDSRVLLRSVAGNRDGFVGVQDMVGRPGDQLIARLGFAQGLVCLQAVSSLTAEVAADYVATSVLAGSTVPYIDTQERRVA